MLPALGGGSQPARVHELALPRPAQPPAPGRAARHRQPVPRHGALLRRRQGHQQPLRSRLRRPQDRLRRRVPPAQPVRDSAAHRVGEEQRGARPSSFRPAPRFEEPDHDRLHPSSRLPPALPAPGSRPRRRRLAASRRSTRCAAPSRSSTPTTRWRPRRRPATRRGAAEHDIDLFYDLSYNMFVTARARPTGIRAQNLNTIDEVPDSSWFTNRIGTRPLTVEEVTRGPVTGPAPEPTSWTICREKSAGAAPGFTATDAGGHTWFVSFDAPRQSRGGDRRGRRVDEDLLGARLQPGRVLRDRRAARHARRSPTRRPSAGRRASAAR